MKIAPLINRLSHVKTYKLMIMVVLLSEVFTGIMNSINSYLWWGRIDRDLLIIGSIDALVVSLLVGGLIILLLNVHRESASAIKESQEHFKLLVDNIPICLALVDSGQNIFYMNNHLTRIMGYTVKDVPDMQTWWPTGYPDEQYRAESMARWSKAVQRAMATGKPIVPEEYNVTCKDGTVLVMEIFGAPVGKYHLVIFDDKTERKSHERQLLMSKEKYEKVIINSPIGITICDSRGQCITTNQAMADMIGATQEQVLQQNFHEIQSWKESGLYDAALLAIKNKRPEQVDIKVVSSFGKEAYFSCYIVPFVPDGLLFMMHDLSRLKDAEEELIKHRDHLEGLVEQRSAELAGSEKRYRELINNTETGFVVIDEKGIVLEANRPYLNLTGFESMEDIIGRSVIDWTAPESLKENAAAIEECVRTGSIKNFETIYIRPDGSRCVIQIDATTYETPSGMRITSFCRNITERKSMEAQRFRASKLESLGFLAGGIAHDFNNKLGTILNNIALAKAYIDPDNEAHKKLVEIEKTYWQTTHLTSQLLTFSKGIRINKTVFSLKQMLEDTVSFALSGSGIVSSFDMDADLLPVEADKGQISQVISNIVLNARDAMQDEGTLTVRAENIENADGAIPVKYDGPLVRFEFMDTGCGISKENLGRIFDPFYSSKPEGHGIGLSISHTIISKHSGLIEVSSREGEGASFIVYLPSSDKPVLEESRRYKDASANTATLRILLMDDDEDFLKSFAEIIETLGHEVHLSTKGEEAMQKYIEFMGAGKTFDLVILDMTIKGGLGGIETFKELKKIDPSVKALVASGYSDKLSDSEYTELGFGGYLRKPFSVDELKRSLSKYL